MGLEYIVYLLLCYFDKKEVVFFVVDCFLCKIILQGFVYDELVVFQGGILGNVGFFFNVCEVGCIYQMLFNGGELDGRCYFSKEICVLFIIEKFKISCCGLGFDKLDVVNESKSLCVVFVLVIVYGYIGFIGICVWVDFDNGLIYVFFSNCIYFDVWVNKLFKFEIREKI